MKFSAPKNTTFLVAVILAVLSLVAFGGFLPALAAYTYWLMTIAFVLLALACMMRGL